MKVPDLSSVGDTGANEQVFTAWTQVVAGAATVLEQSGYRCSRCNRPGHLEVHHVRHLKAGGSPLDVKNLAVLCKNCHIHIHKKLVGASEKAWLSAVKEMRQSMGYNRSTYNAILDGG